MENLIEKFKSEIRSTVIFQAETLEDLRKEDQKFSSMLETSLKSMKDSALFSNKEIDELGLFGTEHRTLAYTQAKTKIITNLRNNWKFFK